MLLVTYYAQNYAGIIGWSLLIVSIYFVLRMLSLPLENTDYIYFVN